jgi:NAD(P)-dependent dehydrogenase (short-subunit alcohol dehydrogenase family)
VAPDFAIHAIMVPETDVRYTMSDNHPALAVFAPDLFEGRTVLVTGGGRGIGRRTALAFGRLGAQVVIGSRNPDNLDAAALEMTQLGIDCLAIPTNIRETEAVEHLLTKAIERFGGIDFLVNNAGGQFPAPPGAISDRGWRAVIDLNLNGTWNVCSRVIPHMIERGFGSIVNIVHNYALDRGAPPFAHSGAARAGVVNLTKTLAVYLARHDITVNALAPGAVSTQGFREDELAQLSDDVAAQEARTLKDIPAGRVCEPDEIAANIAFLCSPAARYISGTTLIVDGGLQLGNWNAILDEQPEYGS